MSKSEDLLAAARAILPELPALLGDEAEAVSRELSALLAQADAGADVEIEIDDLLNGHEATRIWVMRQTSVSGEKSPGARGFSLLPGNHIPPAGVVYVCTDTACKASDFSSKVLSTPPPCPKCGQPMQLKG